MTSIVTKRLRLVTYERPGTVEKMVQWLNDPEVVRYSEQRHKRHDRYSQDKYIISFPFGSGHFREIHTTDAFIGTIAAHVDENNSVANVGILIGEKTEWGKGYGTEAWQAFCDHLLAGGIRKIEAGCMAVNAGMIRIFQKTGMFYEGQLIHHFQFNSSPIDCLHWAKFK